MFYIEGGHSPSLTSDQSAEGASLPSILGLIPRFPLSRPIIEALRTAIPYFPLRHTLPDGRRMLKYFGDHNVPRIVEEVLVAGVYDSIPGLGPRDGDIVFDIGAHIGTYAFRAAKAIGGNGRYIAVEADPRNFSLLRRNVRSLQGIRIDCLNLALWSSPGTVTLHRHPWGFGGHSVVFEHGSDPVEVRADTLDNIVRQLDLSAVSFVKMDVEGAAVEILKGGEETLSKFKPRISCAAYHTPDESQLVADLLRHHGYSVEVKGVLHSYTTEPETYVYAMAE